jgi:hypothetical protein
MPGVGTKQQQSPPTEVSTTPNATPLVTPDAVLGEFGQICVSLPASGALIALLDKAGLRCTVSFGKAPAVGSHLVMDSPFIGQCVQTGEVVLCEDATTEAKVAASVGTETSCGSMITLPLETEGGVVGIMQVFCAQPFAIPPATIASLQTVAKSFAALMVTDVVPDATPVADVAPATGDPEALHETPAIRNSTVERELLSNPVILLNPDLVEKSPAIANRLPNLGGDVAQSASQPSIKRVFSIGAFAEAASAIRARAAARAALLHLPSDKPTPARVWVITAALLLVLSVLILLLFKLAHHTQSESVENTMTIAATHWTRT